jgi:hypothetical protein
VGLVRHLQARGPHRAAAHPAHHGGPTTPEGRRLTARSHTRSRRRLKRYERMRLLALKSREPHRTRKKKREVVLEPNWERLL